MAVPDALHLLEAGESLLLPCQKFQLLVAEASLARYSGKQAEAEGAWKVGPGSRQAELADALLPAAAPKKVGAGSRLMQPEGGVGEPVGIVCGLWAGIVLKTQKHTHLYGHVC